MKLNKKAKGIALAFIGSFFLAIMGSLVPLVQHTVSSSLIISYRFIFGLIIMMPFIYSQKDFSLKVKNVHIILLRSIAAFIAMLLFYISLNFLPVANALLLMNTSPIFVPIFVFLFTGEKSSKSLILFIVLCFIGFVIISEPTSGNHNLIGYLIGISAGILTALATVLLRLVSKDNSPSQLMFYFFFFMSIIGLFIGLSDIRKLSAYEFEILFLIALSGLLYQYGFTHALKLISVRIVSPILLSAVVFAGIIDIFCRNVEFDMNFIIGSIIIASGILGVILSKK